MNIDTAIKLSVYRSIIISMPGSVGSDNTVSMPFSPQSTALLSHLEFARDLIARRLVQDRHSITDPDLNYTTTSTLLQLLFLKAGQECGFVEPGTLTALAGCEGIAKRMGRACSDAGLSPEIFFEKGPADSRMLSGLSDEPLREIIHRLDMPEIPAPISRLSVEELAAVLDHFFGTRMQITEGYRVMRVGKSVLLYTGTVDVPPPTVVEYVVNKTINSSTGSTAGDHIFSGRILDPACGAGLFLLAMFRFLVRKKTRTLNYLEDVGEVLKEIACRSIFGTDIDPDSVSATRFVLLSALIGEMKRSDSLVSPGRISEICSGLTKTIRCGNALIAPDYFSGKPMFPFNADERLKVNPFEWQQAFPEIIAAGGFDAVIGAPPPYRPFAVKAREEYFQTHYDVYAASAGLYGYFIEKGLGLLRSGGILTVLVPGTFLRSQYARPLRRLLLTRQIELIACTGRMRVLPEGEVAMYVLTLRNQPPGRPFSVTPEWNFTGGRQEILSGRHDFTLDQRLFDDGGWKLEDTRTADILKKIQMNGTPLEQYSMGEIGFGIHRVRNNPLVVDPATKNQLTKKAWWCRHFFVPLLRPVDIRRYVPKKPERFVISITKSRDFRKCRALVTYFEKAMSEHDKEFVFNHSTAYPDSDISISCSESEKSRPKIIFSQYQHRPVFSCDPEGTYAISQTLLLIPRNDLFLAGILNSSLGRFVITCTCSVTDRGYHISMAAIGKFPIYTPDFDKPDDKARHDRMVALVNEMLELHKHLSHAKTDQEKRIITQEIESTDRQIDSLVYGLYGLTADEIAVVETCSA